LLAAQSSIDKIEFSTGITVEGGAERAIDSEFQNCSDSLAARSLQSSRDHRKCRSIESSDYGIQVQRLLMLPINLSKRNTAAVLSEECSSEK
jgi:hypothetical protein